LKGITKRGPIVAESCRKIGGFRLSPNAWIGPDGSFFKAQDVLPYGASIFREDEAKNCAKIVKYLD
jgi:hypothetical protein